MDTYSTAFAELVHGIQPSYPRTALFLEHMRDEYGHQIAYYAAFVITCLSASDTVTGSKPISELEDGDLQEFTFFAYSKDNPAALRQFTQVLRCYQAEQ